MLSFRLKAHRQTPLSQLKKKKKTPNTKLVFPPTDLKLISMPKSVLTWLSLSLEACTHNIFKWLFFEYKKKRKKKKKTLNLSTMKQLKRGFGFKGNLISFTFSFYLCLGQENKARKFDSLTTELTS